MFLLSGIGVSASATAATQFLLFGLAPAAEPPPASGQMRYPYAYYLGAAPSNATFCPFSGSLQNPFVGLSKTVVPIGCAVENWVMRLDVPPGLGHSRLFDFMVDGVSIGQIVIAGTDTEGQIAGAVGAIPEDGVVYIDANITGAPDGSNLWIAFETLSDDDDMHCHTGNVLGISTGMTAYFNPFLPSTPSSFAQAAYAPVAAPVTVTRTIGASHFFSLAAGQGIEIALYRSTDDGVSFVKQDGAGGTPDTVVTVENVAEDVAVGGTYSLVLNRGDIIYGEIVAVGSVNKWFSVGIACQATVPGEGNAAGGIVPNPSAVKDSYRRLADSNASTWLVDETVTPVPGWLNTFTFKDPYAWASSAPGSGASRRLRLRVNGASTTPLVTLTGLLKVGDGSGAHPIEPGDEFNVIHTPANVPVVTGQYSYTFIIAPGVSDGGSPDPERFPPEGGGEVGAGVNPPVAILPTGVLRLFFRMSSGTGSPKTVVTGAETTLRDPGSWFGGHKPPILLSVTPVDRELTDDGSFRGTELRVVVADAPRANGEALFRTMSTTHTLSGAYFEYFVVSDTVRYALGEPYRLFAGHVYSHKALPGWKYELVVRDVLSERIADLDEAPRVPPDRLSVADFPGMDAEYEGRAVPLVLGHCSDEDETGLIAQDPQGVIPPVILGQINFTHWGGINQEVIACIWSQSALAANGVWTVYYNPLNTPDVRVVIPISSYGVDVWTPGLPGWEETGLATDYADYPLPLGATTRRYTPFFVRADQALAQAFREGRVLVAANLYGVSENADGTGLYLDDAPRVWQWLIVNQLFSPYKTGEYADIPMLDDEFSIIDTDSVEATVTRLRSFLPGGTYPVGFLLGRDGSQQTLRHVLGELCAGVLMEQGLNRHGQLMVDVEDVDAVATVSLSDLFDIADGEFSVWIDQAAHRNRIEYVYGRRYVAPSAPPAAPAEGEPLPAQPLKPYHEWTSGLRVMTNDPAIAAFGRQRTQVMENYVVRNADVAENVAARMLQRLAGPSPAFDGPRMFSLTTSWQGLQVELGTVIAITHVEGMGATGYEGTRGRVTKISVDGQAARITIEGRILDDLGELS
jgi:hypothetical protein